MTKHVSGRVPLALQSLERTCLKHLYQPLLALTLSRRPSKCATSRPSGIKFRKTLALCLPQKVISDWPSLASSAIAKILHAGETRLRYSTALLARPIPTSSPSERLSNSLRCRKRRDIEAGFEWYQSEQPGLGLEFLDEIRAAYARIVRILTIGKSAKGAGRK